MPSISKLERLEEELLAVNAQIADWRTKWSLSRDLLRLHSNARSSLWNDYKVRIDTLFISKSYLEAEIRKENVALSTATRSTMSSGLSTESSSATLAQENIDGNDDAASNAEESNQDDDELQFRISI